MNLLDATVPSVVITYKYWYIRCLNLSADEVNNQTVVSCEIWLWSEYTKAQRKQRLKKKKKSIDICSPWKSVAENNLTSWNTISTMAVLQQHHSISVYCVKLWVHNQILCPVTGKQTAIIISLIRRNSTFEGYIAHLISLNKLKCGRGIMEAKEMFGPSKSDLGGMVILAIKKERATSSPTYVGGSLSETWNMYEKGHEKSMDNFPGGICTFLSLSGFVQFSWMTPLPNFSFK